MAIRTRLGRAARGLPRYFMDCGWWQHPNFVGTPLDALGLMSCLIGYCTAHGTDGTAPADPEDLAAVLGLRVREVRKALTALIDRGHLEIHDGQVVVPGWADHNPTSDEVEAYTSERSKTGSYGNHKRWHADRGEWKPDECVHCAREAPPDPPHDRSSDRSSDRYGIAEVSHGMGWDGMGVDTSTGTTAMRPDQPVENPTDWSELQIRRVAQAVAQTVTDVNDDWLRSELRLWLTEHPDADERTAVEALARRASTTEAVPR